MNTSTFLFLVIFMFVSALAVKHISFILIVGSIFEPMRRKIQKNFNWTDKKVHKFFLGKINELLSCNLCLTAQVSIWFIAVPFYLFLYTSNHHFLVDVFNFKIEIFLEIFLNFLVVFLFSMAIASLAYVFWTISEYLPKKLKIMEDFYKEQILIQIKATSSVKKTSKEVKNTVQFSDVFKMKDFENAIDFIDNNCVNIDCAIERRNCRQENLNKFLKKWIKNIDDEEDGGVLFLEAEIKIQEVLRIYYSEGYFSQKRKKFLFEELSK